MKPIELLDLLNSRISAERICHLAQAIHKLDQWNSFDRYRQTADLLVREFREAKADAVDRHVIPCDGETVFGDWVMPLAWDAQDGTLELLDLEGNRKMLLADYRAVPNHLVRWSAPTAGPQEFPILYLPEAAKEKDWAGAGAQGKFIFTHSRPRDVRRWAVKFGAVGIASDFSTAPEAFPDRVHWENDWTGLALWGPTKSDAPLVGFCLSPSMGRQLKTMLGSWRACKMVRANVRAKLYSGSTDVLSAKIAGGERPDEEIVTYAHIYECQIDDNATSAAACVEIVHALRGLIDAGLLPPPRRTIRFVLGWEWIGSTYYGLHLRGNKRWLASLCLDGMAHKQEETRSPIGISLSPTSAANYADALFVDLWKQHFRRQVPARAWQTNHWTAGTDTYWIDPHLGGVSNVYPFQQPGPTWHKSHTSAADIDREVVRTSAAVCASWMHSLAGAGAKEAARFARLGADRAERRIRQHGNGFDFSRRDVDAAREQFSAEQGCLEEAARRMVDTTALAPDDAPLRKTVDQLQDRVDAALTEARDHAQAALAATRSAVPDWEARRPADLMRDRDERVADTLTPSRLVSGYLWSLHRFSVEDLLEFQSLGRLDPLCLFLCDGKRTLLEIARRREFEAGPIKLRDLIRQFRMLAEAGYVNLASRKTWTAEELLAGLREMGIREGDTLFAHSSLSSFGALADGADTVFAALEQAVGKEGTLVMPTFSHCTIDKPVHDIATTPSKVGELTDLFWRRAGVFRSRHPSHGVSAWGRRAEWIVRGQELGEPYAIEGPFGKFYQLDAKIVMLGCGVTSNSTLHAIEDWSDLPSMQPARYHYLDEGGQRVEREYRKVPFHLRDFYTSGLSAYERLFREKCILHEGRVGLARSFLMRSRDVMEYGLSLVKDRQFRFLLTPALRDPALLAIEDQLAKSWKFPEAIWDKLKALRETPPGS